MPLCDQSLHNNQQTALRRPLRGCSLTCDNIETRNSCVSYDCDHVGCQVPSEVNSCVSYDCDHVGCQVPSEVNNSVSCDCDHVGVRYHLK